MTRDSTDLYSNRFTIHGCMDATVVSLCLIDCYNMHSAIIMFYLRRVVNPYKIQSHVNKNGLTHMPVVGHLKIISRFVKINVT